MIATMHASDFFQALKTFPWRSTAATLRERFAQDRLGNTASSLTFTTVVSLVPLFAVVLAVLSAFPMFDKLQGSLQQWLAASLIPDPIAKQVMGYLTQFAGKASRLGVLGVIFLLVAAISLILTIDRTLNSIWRVRRPRPLVQRVLVYWAVLTLGPLLLGVSVALSSYAVSASRGLVNAMPGTVRVLLDTVEFLIVFMAVTGLYRFVPYTLVRWRDALTGAVVAALALELAKTALGVYIKSVPTYSLIYGAFATVPILLLWIYLAWLIVLMGAVIAAYLPVLLGAAKRSGDHPGWQFEWALEVLGLLHARRQAGQIQLSQEELARQLSVQTLELESVLQALMTLQWLGRLEDGRVVLLIDLQHTKLTPLVHQLLLSPDAADSLMRATGWRADCSVADAIGVPQK